MVILGNPRKRIYLAIVGIRHFLAGRDYRSSPPRRLSVREVEAATDPVPVPICKSVAPGSVEA